MFEVVVVRGGSQMVSLIHPHTGRQHMINKQFPGKNIIHRVKSLIKIFSQSILPNWKAEISISVNIFKVKIAIFCSVVKCGQP